MGAFLAVMLNSFQHLLKFDFSAFGRRTFHPCPQEGVFRCGLNKKFHVFSFKFQVEIGVKFKNPELAT
jgi:hypothetical protein